MRKPFFKLLYNAGYKIKIYVTICLLLFVNIYLNKTNPIKVIHYSYEKKHLFVFPHNKNYSTLKKKALFKKYRYGFNKIKNYWAVNSYNEAVSQTDITTEVQKHVQVNENANEKVNENANEKVNENANEKVNENANENANEHANEKANEQANEKANEQERAPGEGIQFSDINEINKNIANYLKTKGIKYMTKIQAKSFGLIYEGNDMIARSETGSGKTLAFALPLVEKLHKMRVQIGMSKQSNDSSMDGAYTYSKMNTTEIDTKNPSILVLEPTRELSKQVETTFKEISKFYNFNVMSIYGGESYTYQENKLRKGVDIVTGTPGRIIDHIERNNLSLKNIKYLVLDEADEMLNLGFTQDIERILRHIDLKKAQVLLYSATTPSWIKDVCSKYLKNPRVVDVVDSVNKTAKNIKHIAIKTPHDIKEKALLLEDVILVKSNGGQVIIFTRTKLEADTLCSEGSFKSLSFAVLHGNIAQSTREHTMQRFRSGLFQVLIATDIAARGLDINNVDLVIQCYCPMDTNIYIHRAGRTGRANKNGLSILLYSDEDKHNLIKLERACGIQFTYEKLPNNEDVFFSASTLAAKKIENLNTDVLPFFQKTAIELINKCNALNITQTDLIARCLAIISKKENIKKRSLISGLSEIVTLNFVNKTRSWKNESDILYWINKVSNELNINTFDKILQIKLNNKDKTSAFFDLNQNLAEQLIQNFENLSKQESKQMFHLAVAQRLPDQMDLSSDPYSNSRYSQQHRRRPSYGVYRRRHSYR
uniref:RNA helicase n=1 Tax=Piliocolobus tephrosceles TaxID=591936 RepID=A0A8C9GS06_9PRIM